MGTKAIMDTKVVMSYHRHWYSTNLRLDASLCSGVESLE